MKKKLLSLLLVCLLVVPLLTKMFGVTVYAEALSPDVSFTLTRGSVTTPVDQSQPLNVSNGDRLRLSVTFSEASAGDSCTISLPSVFVGLDINEIRQLYADIPELQFDLTAKTAEGQDLIVTFLEDATNISIYLETTLTVTSSTVIEDNTIKIDNETILTIVPTPPPVNPGTGGVTETPGSIPDSANGGAFNKRAGTATITQSQFLESSNQGNAFFYMLDVNYGLRPVSLTETLSDTLPEYMKLFTANAPDNPYYDAGYDEAYRSFGIVWLYNIIEHDASGYYIDWSGASKSTLLGYLNATETAQSRSTYTVDDVDWRLNISDDIAAAIENSEGTVASYDYGSIGYRMESDGKLHFYVISSNYPDEYEETRYDAWSVTSNTKCVPLYTVDGSSSVYTTRLFGFQDLQVNGSGTLVTGVTREAGSEPYSWVYKYEGNTFMTLTVNPDASGGSDSFKVDFDVDATDRYFGGCLRVAPRVWFDRDLISDASGVITFNNQASYGSITSSVENKYTYSLSGGGMTISNPHKTVNKTNVNPEASPQETLDYSLTFKKSGTVPIAQGEFKANDVLNENVEFVEGSIKIYQSTDGTNWTEVSSDVTDTSTSAGALNLTASYLPDEHKITITNPDAAASFTSTVKVEFKVKLKAGTTYGTQLPNTFGDTVKTTTDHKIAIRKTDGSNLITASNATFTIGWATALNGTTTPLANNDGSVGALTTSGGQASALFRQDLDTFYIKLTETTAPTYYTAISDPIWIKAEFDKTKNIWVYSLESAPAGVTLGTDAQNMITLNVANTRVAPDPDAVTVNGNKTLTQDGQAKAMTAGQFSFSIAADSSNDTTGYTGFTPGSVDVASNGTFSFGEINFTKAGTYKFNITEDNKGAPGYTYDNKTEVLTVNVTLDLQTNKLTAAESYSSGNPLSFANTYEADGTSLVLTGTKTATGRALTDNQFSFSVYEGTTEVATGSNNAVGEIRFTEILYDEAGDHTYEVRETSTSGDGWTVDDTVHTVNVTVVDNGDGTLTATASYPSGEPITFANNYEVAETGLVLTGTKTATGKELSDDQFDFAVYEGETKVATGTNNAAGEIKFSEIVYEESGNHTYEVRETSTSEEGWTVDDTVHTVNVTVVDNGDGTLTATPAYPADGLVFHNTYTEKVKPISNPKSPSKSASTGKAVATGDESDTLYYVLLLVTGVAVGVGVYRKRRNAFR